VHFIVLNLNLTKINEKKLISSIPNIFILIWNFNDLMLWIMATICVAVSIIADSEKGALF